jgi:hypothetical protein
MLFLFTILFINQIYAYRDKDEAINSKVSSVIHLQIGGIFTSSNPDFFEIYRRDLGGTAEAFSSSPTVSLSGKYTYKDIYKMGYSISFLKTKINDVYEQRIGGSNLARREVFQDINFTDFPVLFLFEFNPKQRHQFKSYAGIGVGTVISKVYWYEDIMTFDWDTRKGGTVHNRLMFFPTLRLYVCTELGFDKENEESFLGGITIEPRLNYVYRNVDLFSPIIPQIDNDFHNLGKRFWFNNFIFEINFGLTLNFYHIKKGA